MNLDARFARMQTILGCSECFRKTQKRIPPIQHLLILHFLGHDVRSIIQFDETINEPFGSGPWPCLNRVCVEYGQKVISRIAIHGTYKHPIGNFECPKCGFVYSRRGPDRSPEDAWIRTRIVDVGESWKNKLVELAQGQNMSLAAKAEQLGVSRKMVWRYQSILFDKKAAKEKQVSSQKEKNSKRRSWLKLIKAHPELGINELRKLQETTFTWLYDHDREWLNTHRPKPAKRIIPNNRVRLAKTRLGIGISEFGCSRTKRAEVPKNRSV